MVMAAAPISDDLQFLVPTIGKSVYLVKGPSGWTETFKREKLDRELVAFICPLALADAVDLFITARELSDNKDPTNWFTIVGFLGRTMGVSPRAVPHTVGIAFWAAILLGLLAREAN